MEISVKQAELAGVGIIISNSELKKSLKGRIYEATAYYENKAVEVKVLYKRNGIGLILGPLNKNAIAYSEYEMLLRYLIPRMPKPNYITVGTIRLGTIISAFITLLNLLQMSNVTGAMLVVADIVIIAILMALEKSERRRYV